MFHKSELIIYNTFSAFYVRILPSQGRYKCVFFYTFIAKCHSTEFLLKCWWLLLCPKQESAQALNDDVSEKVLWCAFRIKIFLFILLCTYSLRLAAKNEGTKQFFFNGKMQKMLEKASKEKVDFSIN